MIKQVRIDGRDLQHGYTIQNIGRNGKPQLKKSLGKPRYRYKYNIKVELRKSGFGGVDWIKLARDMVRLYVLVSLVISLRIP